MNDWQKRMGVGLPQYNFGRHAGGTHVTPVVADDGPLRGQQVGKRKEHWSGRVDAKVERAELIVNPNLQIKKVTNE